MSAVATHISVEPGSEAFPLLTPAQIERLRPHGKLRHVEAGEVLFEPGDSNVPVYVVLSGSLEILQPCPKGV
jgi:thioredoxin reductase (NADPH)